MTPIAMLWLPIVLSSVLVFIVSSIIHMAPLWHKNDFKRTGENNKIQEALRPFNLTPGEYLIPHAESQKEMGSPEHKEKLEKGPVAIITVRPSGAVKMGSFLAQWFVYLVVVGICSAYIAGRALPAGSDYLSVFRFVGTTAFFCYAIALWQYSIWYARPWSTSFKSTIDGLIYALLTAGIFGWLWPAA